MGLNDTYKKRIVSKKSVIDFKRRLAGLKPTLMLYALLHQFIHQEIEGDELLTIVDKNLPASESPRMDNGLDGARQSISMGIALWSERPTVI
ncbi:hypothetical protein [Moorena producens]|uniref:hypothetical protein n=1 Tax=Moorena producens TaxID=1155739 RepID=UPI003C7809FD